MDSWEFMRIRGIPLRLHPSWFLVFIYLSLSMKGQVATYSEAPIPIFYEWLVGVWFSILFFISVLLHELGHSFVATHEGAKVKNITLFFLGGIAVVEKECATAMANFRVAIAGPLVSITLSLLFFGISAYYSEYNSFISRFVGQIAILNMILSVFNLLPVLPLDGGMLLKSLVWHFTGSQVKGIKASILTGLIISLSIISFGVWICFAGPNTFIGLWTILIGLFSFSSCRSQSQILDIQRILARINVKTISRRDYRVLEDKMNLRVLSTATPAYGSGNLNREWILLCREGRWVGYVKGDILKDIPSQYWDLNRLSDYIRPLSELPSVNEKDLLWKAIFILEKTKVDRLLILNSAGFPCGTLDRADIGKIVLKQIGLDIPVDFIKSARKQKIYPLGLSLPKIVDSMLSLGLIDNKDTFSSKK